MLAPVIADLQSLMGNVKAVPMDRIRVDGSRDHQLPPIEFGERAHTLYALVAGWAVQWAAAVGSAGPAHLANFNPDGRVTRIPSGLSSFTAARSTASWLIGHHDEIKMLPEAPTYAISITAAIADEARFLGYRPRQRPVKQKRCRACDSVTLKLVWHLDSEPRLKCTACGGAWECGPQLAMMTLTDE